MQQSGGLLPPRAGPRRTLIKQVLVPLPEKNGNRDTITVLFSYIRLVASYIASQLYLAYAKLYCPTGSFGGEYNITAAKRQYRFCIAKISLRRSRNITKNHTKGSVVADRQQLQSHFFIKCLNNLTKGRRCVHFGQGGCADYGKGCALSTIEVCKQQEHTEPSPVPSPCALPCIKA